VDALKTPWARLGLVISVTAILVIVVRDRLEASETTAWDQLAAARMDGFTAEELEGVWREVGGSSAEPWAAFHLAMTLYDEGTDLDRARQVADSTMKSFPDHATAPMLGRLIEALDSYSG
jgi:hypothetical protein